MAQPGNFTPILLYGSSTPTNVPLAANLTNSATGSEIAINVADKNLFFKDNGGVVNTVPIRQSSTSSNGWLSNTDWNTFNSKAPATSGSSILYGNGSGGFSNVTIGSGISFAGGTLSATGTGGTVTSVAALTIGTTGTDLSSTVANGTTTPVITLQVPTASATNRGALSSTDWSTFNNKQAALVSGTNIKTVGGVSLLGSGDVGTIGVAYGGTGQTTFTSGQLLFGNGTSGINSSANFAVTNSTFTTLGTSSSQPIIIIQPGASAPGGFNRSLFKLRDKTGTDGWDIVDYGDGANYLTFESVASSTATEKIRFWPAGGVSIGNTTDPGAGNLRLATTETNGIYFGASSKLADYEEGTWTPQPTFGLGNTGMAYTSSGVYRKIGKFVHLQCTIQFSNKGSSTGIFRINTIPYANINGYGSGAGVVPYYANLIGLTGSFVTRIDAGNATYILPGYDDTGAGPGVFTETNFTNTSRIDLHLIYETA